MIRGLYTVGTGMLTQRKKLDVLANNLANVDTAGFKQDKLLTRSFQDVLIRRIGDSAGKNEVGPYNYGLHTDAVATDFIQGPLDQTDRMLDLAIEGEGFFAVNTEDGIRYTRAGAFRVDENLRIVTADGYPLLGTNGEPFVLASEDVQIDKEGNVYNEGVYINTIQLTNFTNVEGLRKIGDNLYEALDDAGAVAAGMAISEKMKAQIRGLEMAAKNSQDAISLIQTAEGALTETHAILQRMNELAVQSASDTNQDNVDREALQQEFVELKKEINDIASKTTFNGRALLDGTFGNTVAGADDSTNPLGLVNVIGGGPLTAGEYDMKVTSKTASEIQVEVSSTTVTDFNTVTATIKIDGDNGDKTVLKIEELDLTIELNQELSDLAVNDAAKLTVTGATPTFQTGSLAGDELALKISNMSTTGLQIDSADISTREGATAAITSVNNAINLVSTERAKLGAYQNRLEHKINSLNISAENLQAAESRIRDVDMAKEMMIFTKNNILTQAATAMLAQANQTPQTVLQLLR
jgi:flagellin